MTPHQEIEAIVLGACMVEDAKALEYVTSRILPEHFAYESHIRSYRAVQALHAAGNPVNLVTVHHELGAAAQGEMAYLSDVVGMGYLGCGNPAEYVGRLIRQWRVRKLRSLGELLTTQADDPQADPDAIMEQFGAQMEHVDAAAAKSDVNVFADFAEFVTAGSTEVEWALGGIIERGANGFIAAEPKGSKSFCTADLALALATGTSWLGFAVPQPMRVALVSREDNPALTRWRLEHLRRGREFNMVQMDRLEANLYVNSRAQTRSLMLDNDMQMNELIAAVKDRKIEMVFLDVLNVLHQADENDNTAMAHILRRVRRIQDRTGASVGILHHYNKNEGAGRITQRLRGASAIAGFAEWIIGISMADDEAKIRRMDFEIKAGNAPEPIHFCIHAEGEGPARLARVQMQSQARQPRQSKGVM